MSESEEPKPEICGFSLGTRFWKTMRSRLEKSICTVNLHSLYLRGLCQPDYVPGCCLRVRCEPGHWTLQRLILSCSALNRMYNVWQRKSRRYCGVSDSLAVDMRYISGLRDCALNRSLKDGWWIFNHRFPRMLCLGYLARLLGW